MSLKFKISKDAPKKLISYVQSITGEDTILLSAVRAADGSGKCVIEGAAHGVYVRALADADVESTGIVILNGTQFSGVKYPADIYVSATSSDKSLPSRVNVRSGTFKADIPTGQNGGPIRTSRPDPEKVPKNVIVVPKDLVTKAIQSAVFSHQVQQSSTDGVVIQIEGGKFTLYAYDGVRASVYSADLDHGDTTLTAVMSYKFFEYLKRIPGEGTIDFSSDSGTLYVQTNAAYLVHPQLLVQPSNVPAEIQAFSEESQQGMFSISSKALAKAVDTVLSVRLGGSSYGDPVQLGISDGEISISIASDDDEATETLTLDGDNEDCVFSLSSRHMQEILSMTTGSVAVTVYSGCIILRSDEGRSTLMLSTYAR